MAEMTPRPEFLSIAPYQVDCGRACFKTLWMDIFSQGSREGLKKKTFESEGWAALDKKG